ASMRDPQTGELPFPGPLFGPHGLSPPSKVTVYNETTFDKLVEIHSDGTAWFMGANAQKVYASMQSLGLGAMLPVPVTILKEHGEQYEHFGNDMTHGGNDLMGGLGLNLDLLYGISALDLAVMQDLGAPVKQMTVDPAKLIGQHDPAIDAI